MKNIVDEFQANIENLIGRFAEFKGLDLAQAIGVLEVVKHDLIYQHKSQNEGDECHL